MKVLLVFLLISLYTFAAAQDKADSVILSKLQKKERYFL